MRALLLALLVLPFASQSQETPPPLTWEDARTMAKLMHPDLQDPDSKMCRRFLANMNVVMSKWEIEPLDAVMVAELTAQELATKQRHPAFARPRPARAPSPTLNERLAAAGNTEFEENPRPTPQPQPQEEKPVVIYPTGGGNYRASDGTVILRTGDGFMVVPKK